jgi:hypothetical protein
MGHYGKHIIDPETGLCEICDKGVLHEIRQGKRPGKQVYYSQHDDRYDEIPYARVNKCFSNIYLSLLNIIIGSTCI